MKVADWPNLKKADRQKLHKTVYKSAYKYQKNDDKPLSMEEFAAIISAKVK